MEDRTRRTVSLLFGWLITAFFALLLLSAGEVIGEVSAFFLPFPDIDETWTAVFDTFRRYISTWGTWAVFAAVMAFIPRNRYMLEKLSFREKGNGLKFWLLGIALGFGPNALCALAARLNGDIFPVFDRFDLLPALLLLFAVYVQSSSEELVCRVYVYQRLLKTYECPLVAALGNSLMFMSLHLMNPGINSAAMYNIFIVGFLYSLFIYYWDSFQMAAWAHCAWNYTQNILFGLPNSGIVVPYSIFKLDAASAQDSFFYNVAFGLEGTGFCNVLLTVLTVIVFLYGRKKTGKRIERREVQETVWYTMPAC